jgi:hypothetical protein
MMYARTAVTGDSRPQYRARCTATRSPAGLHSVQPGLNRYTLIAKNLPTSQTKVYMDDQNRDFSSDELAKGVNLAEAEPADHPFGGIAP